MKRRTKQGEANRIASLPKGDKHWNYSKTPSLLTLHKRIHRNHGSAKEYDCGCGKQAQDWAFIGQGEYTDKREDYQPMCRSCHMQMDGHAKKVDRSKHEIIRDKKGRILKTIVKN